MIIQFGLSLVPESGGTFLSVSLFKKALNSSVYSFTEEQLYDKINENEKTYCTHIFCKNFNYILNYGCPKKMN